MVWLFDGANPNDIYDRKTKKRQKGYADSVSSALAGIANASFCLEALLLFQLFMQLNRPGLYQIELAVITLFQKAQQETDLEPGPLAWLGISLLG